MLPRETTWGKPQGLGKFRLDITIAGMCRELKGWNPALFFKASPGSKKGESVAILPFCLFFVGRARIIRHTRSQLRYYLLLHN